MFYKNKLKILKLNSNSNNKNFVSELCQIIRGNNKVISSYFYNNYFIFSPFSFVNNQCSRILNMLSHLSCLRQFSFLISTLKGEYYTYIPLKNEYYLDVFKLLFLFLLLLLWLKERCHLYGEQIQKEDPKRWSKCCQPQKRKSYSKQLCRSGKHNNCGQTQNILQSLHEAKFSVNC